MSLKNNHTSLSKPDYPKLKLFLRIQSGNFIEKSDFKTERDSIFSYPVYGGNGLIGFTNKYNVLPDTIVVGRVGALCGNVHLITEKAWVTDNSLVLNILLKEKLEYAFLYYLLKSLNLNQYSQSTAQPLITSKTIKERYFKLPSIVDQENIAIFIFNKTSEIDALISDKEKLIKLLEEKRQAIITEAVTKGLNPDVKMKDSGVEWIGEIPEHWRINKLKYLFNIRTGGTPKSNNLEYWDDKGIIWITPGDLSSPGETISDSYKKISEVGLINSSANYISKNSIVISTRAPIGNMKIATMKYTTNQGCKSLESKNENHNIIYYFNLLRYRKNILESLGQGTTFLELSSNSLKEFEVPVMNKEEQDRIVEVIQSINNISDKLLVQINKQIYKLKEYRQALIYDAVTGKIDIQEMVKKTEQEEVSSS